MLQRIAQTDQRRNCDLAIGSRWPHALALLLVGATWLMICVGGLVTTLKAGMAFADWPTSDGYNMFLYPWFKAAHDKFIEHGHRLFGTVIGMLSIAVAVVIWLRDSRRWMRWLGAFAVGLVIFQGALGGMRVELDDVQFAKIHGCIGPLFFSLTVVLAVCTSRWWCKRAVVPSHASGRLKRLAVCTALLAYVQLILGAQLRHVPPMANGSHVPGKCLLPSRRRRHFAGQRGASVAGLRKANFRSLADCSGRVDSWLPSLPVSGCWVRVHGFLNIPGLPGGLPRRRVWRVGRTPRAAHMQSLVVTGHVAVGSLILGTCVWMSLAFGRVLVRKSVATSSMSPQMVGVPT